MTWTKTEKKLKTGYFEHFKKKDMKSNQDG